MHRQTKYYNTHKPERRLYYQVNKMRIRAARYRRIYGVTLEQYNIMFLQQNGLCLGCYKHQKDDRRTFAVDHNHATGKVRGLLCGNCNVALGNAQDSPIILRRLADYLEARGVLPLVSH